MSRLGVEQVLAGVDAAVVQPDVDVTDVLAGGSQRWPTPGRHSSPS